MNSREVRQRFIDFFVGKGHTIAKPSPVISDADPTLMFTNAGMNQFKDVFLGQGDRPYKRAVNSQVCIRVSGKHNDLEEVGFDGTHLTLFEMLGNWSFGDYYKEESIVWAWELFTEVFKLPKAKLFATVFESDDESHDLWLSKTDIRRDHVIRLGAKDNFWEMGETGPCGPCSEIHIGDSPETMTELWNLVFIQFNRRADRGLDELPKKHVDTGAGLERLCSVLQGKNSAYDTDLFIPIIQRIEELTKIKQDVPHRVMADHVRMLTFAIADNALPSNEGRGYVVRRILRRAVRYARKLNINEPVLYKLVDPVVEILGGHFEHIQQRKDFVKSLIQEEEKSFLRTLDSGIKLFTKISENQTALSGGDVFKLYDTYGFPMDLTRVMAKEKGIAIDEAGFEAELQKQKERSRGAVKKIEEVSSTEDPRQTYDQTDLPRLHHTEQIRAAKGGEAKLIFDPEQKLKMARHHTVTHLLQAALRTVLGNHVTQAGSLVDVDRLRFDFTHFKAVSPDELAKVEAIVNEKIKAKIPVIVQSMPLDEAKAKGAMALFGEKYEDIVRVVQIDAFSMELCGGTHVTNTGVIEAFKIVSESAVAAGTRRIEAVAGQENVILHSDAKKLREKEAAEADANRAKLKEQEKLRQRENEKRAQEEAQEIISELKSEQLLCRKFSGYELSLLRTLSDKLAQLNPDLLIVLASEFEGKGYFLAKVPKSANRSADELVKRMTSVAGGGGGGKPEYAQAGGADVSKLDQALQEVRKIL